MGRSERILQTEGILNAKAFTIAFKRKRSGYLPAATEETKEVVRA